MKSNILKRFKRSSDLFQTTQRRLTMQYSGLIMLFLILFIVVVYTLLYVVILRDQHRELENLTRQETRIISDYLAESARNELQGLGSQELVLAGVDQFFYYVTDENGDFVMGGETLPHMREELFELVSGWVPERNQIREETLEVTFDERRIGGREIDESPKSDTVRLMVDGSPIFYNGQFVGMIYIGKDISFAYQLFTWLLIVLVSLAVLFAGVAVWLSFMMSKKAMGPISTAFQRQKEFVGDASHELRTPLSVMLSSIDALEMTDGVEEDPFAGKLLRNMKSEVKRMTGLVSDLLVLARADSGSVERTVEELDMEKEAAQVIESLTPYADSAGVSLFLEGPAPLFVNGDRARLKQLLYILLDNAVKYSPDGGQVKVMLSQRDRHWTMSVSDEGIGIDAEDQSRIFDRFFRSDKSRTRTVGGHGLGLSIAKWIAGIHGGTIAVKSEPGNGSTFTVQLPTDQQDGTKRM
ncbi:sensor histidine kinase [Domibacillus enclensis]|uniref:histidine kinase n=1 Tax=Domibacillus enclensis TaxID=1017273 RepID=A0ABX4E7P7_9BACI|nr:HAMP domain-containing sensor histidine kinase [Domibacillus enclensis]OXS77400.1 two-component sensor histidine kinase [Domibacillus enclensis]